MTTNPNNYPGASATIVGFVRRKGNAAYDKDGSKGTVQLAIPVDSGYKKDDEWVKTGTAWYNYTARGDFAENVLGPINVGDKVRIDDAKLEAVEFAEGKLRLDLSYGTVTVLESKGAAQADPGFGGSDERPF